VLAEFSAANEAAQATSDRRVALAAGETAEEARIVAEAELIRIRERLASQVLLARAHS
jgi:hypothetical protein